MATRLKKKYRILHTRASWYLTTACYIDKLTTESTNSEQPFGTSKIELTQTTKINVYHAIVDSTFL